MILSPPNLLGCWNFRFCNECCCLRPHVPLSGPTTMWTRLAAQFKKLEYEWTSNNTPLYFDLHGEPKGDTTGYFESYTIATSDEMKGSFTTPFAGSHGWYWKNTTESPITVKLIVKGEYISHSLKQ